MVFTSIWVIWMDSWRKIFPKYWSQAEKKFFFEKFWKSPSVDGGFHKNFVLHSVLSRGHKTNPKNAPNNSWTGILGCHQAGFLNFAVFFKINYFYQVFVKNPPPEEVFLAKIFFKTSKNQFLTLNFDSWGFIRFK